MTNPPGFNINKPAVRRSLTDVVDQRRLAESCDDGDRSDDGVRERMPPQHRRGPTPLARVTRIVCCASASIITVRVNLAISSTGDSASIVAGSTVRTTTFHTWFDPVSEGHPGWSHSASPKG